MNVLAFRRITLLAAAVFLMAISVQARALAQDATPETPAPPPPACVPDDVTACVNVVFYPGTLVGDLILVDKTLDPALETPTPQVQQSSLWVTFANPAVGMTADIAVRNIHDGAEMDTVLYMYPDIVQTVTSPSAPNTTKTVTLYPLKKYIRGRVDAKCSPQNVLEGEDVSCAVTLDGTPVDHVLAAGETVPFFLDPGKHTFQFDLVGQSIALWSPPSVTKTTIVYAGAYAQKATATFAKANHLMAKLSVADWVGDFYLDGTLVSPQAPTLDLFVAGNKTHKLEVRNIALPGSPLIHPYYDASRTFYAYANGTSSITVTILKVPQYATQNITAALFDGTALKSDMYLDWWPAWGAQSPELAEESANHVFLMVTLDGAYIGDVSPYRAKAFTQSEDDGTFCGDPSWIPCYTLVWKIPFGRLSGGSHSIHAASNPFDTEINIGWTIYPGGSWFEWHQDFTVEPAQ